MGFSSIELLPLAEKRVFIRVDFNVPLTQQGEVSDDTRIREVLPTLRHALDKRAKVILASHLGRPDGKVDPSLSLGPVAQRLEKLLGRSVRRASDCVGPAVKAEVARLSGGEVLLLENLRFHAEEEKNDPAFAAALAELADVYINDAFGSSHRSHASVVGMVRHCAHRGIGFLMKKEIDALSRLLESPEKPFLVILGGAKVSDKIGLIRGLLAHACVIAIGGAMAYTLLRAQGVSTGKSKVETNQIVEVDKILKEADTRRVVLLLPRDHVVVDKVGAGEPTWTTPDREIPGDKIGVDIGPNTIDAISTAVSSARTIFWNGPMGVFEISPFDGGTKAVAQAVGGSGAFSVAGGGDTVAALVQSGQADRMDHISTGGGASLEFLEKGDLPGLAALREEI